MDKKQFLEYEWEYGNVEIALHVGKYLYDESEMHC